MASWEYPATGPVTADISLPAGSVKVTAKQTETVRVFLVPGNRAGERLLEETEVSFEGGTLRVQVPRRVLIRGNPSLDLTIELPEGSSVAADTASADLTLTGRLASLNGKTASGDVHADRVSGDVELTTASGDIQLEDSGGEVRVSTASGDVTVGRAGGDLVTKTASGDVRIGQACQSASAKTASGDVRIESIATGLAEVATVSGDVIVAVVPGVDVYLDISTLSGDVRSELDSASPDETDGETSLTVSCRTVSGDVQIIRAR